MTTFSENELSTDTAAIIAKRLRDQAYLAERDSRNAYDDMRNGNPAGPYGYTLAVSVSVGWDRLVKAVESGLLDRLDQDGEVF